MSTSVARNTDFSPSSTRCIFGAGTRTASKHTPALSTKDSFSFAAKLSRAILIP